MRFVMGLTVVGAALLACGVMLVLVGSALRLKSPHDGRGFVHAGEAVAACGLAFGVGLLVVLIMDLADRAGRGRLGQAKSAGPRPAPDGLVPLPSPETGPAEPRQEPVVELKLASRYPGPDHSGNRWQPDAGNGSYPPPDNGPDPQTGGSWSPGPAHVWSSQGAWDGGGESGWSPAEADDWADDGRGGGDPAGPGGWGLGGQPDQQEWAVAGPGGWGPPGQGGWDSSGQDGWSRDVQQQWVADGQGGWVGAGQDGWSPAGQGDWDHGGQPDQREWAAAAEDGWARDGLGGWGPAGQGGWGPGGQPDQQEWAAAGQGGWDSSGQDGWSRDGPQQWVPDGQGGWVGAGQDGWGPGGQDGWGPGGLGHWDQGGQQEWAPAGQDGWPTGGDHDWGVAEPAANRVDPPVNTPVSDVAGREPAQDGPRSRSSEPAPGIAVTKSVKSDDDDTAPLPVIRDVSPPAPETAAEEPDPAPEPGQNQAVPLSVFEPAPKKSVFEPGPKRSVFEPGPKQKASEPDRSSGRDSHPGDTGRSAKADPLPAETRAKLEQIKDLYLTAEAIGEDALVKHFDQLSQRQRSLIREFFDQAGLGSSRTSALLSDDPADDGESTTQDGASLPG
jgi:hypothetical protein